VLFIAVSDNQYNARFVVSALYLVSSNIYIYIYIYINIFYIFYIVLQDTTQEAIFVDISISQVIK